MTDQTSSRPQTSYASVASVALAVFAAIILGVGVATHPISLALAAVAVLVGIAALVDSRQRRATLRWMAWAGIGVSALVMVIVAVGVLG